MDIADLVTAINKNILTTDHYTFGDTEIYDLALDDNVVIYNNGNYWCIVPLIIALSHPIIYDTYNYEADSYDVSIILCPITLQCSMIRGTFLCEKYIDGRMMMLREKLDTDTMVNILGCTDNENDEQSKHVMQENKRVEVKILTLRCAIKYTQDAPYMQLRIKKTKPIIPLQYYENTLDIAHKKIPHAHNIHPKTLVYLVKYHSVTKNKDKYTVIVGKDAADYAITGYDIDKSGLNSHLTKYRLKIMDKNGYIVPILWYMVQDMYSDATFIYLAEFV